MATTHPPTTGRRRAPRTGRAALGVALGAALGAAGCGPGGDRALASGRAGGTVVIATAGDVESLVPPLVQGTTARQVTDLVFEPLAEIGPALNTVGDKGFGPRLARGWTWAADSLSIAFHLDPRARWHDGSPVRAADVRFTFDLYRDPAARAPASDLVDIDSVSVRDSLTPVFWFRRRSLEQFYSAVVPMRILPAARLRGVPPDKLAQSAFARAPVGSGPFRFAGRAPGVSLTLEANPAYHLGRPPIDRVVWSVTPDPTAAVARLLSREADVYEAIRPEQLALVARRSELTTLRYPGLTYGYLLFNVREGPLADRALRRALAAALDRGTMVRNVFDTLGVVALGPFTRAQPSADTTVAQPVYDPAAAARALDALGWRAPDPGGVRARAGRPLAFTLLAPSSSQPRLRYAVLIQEQLRRVGVDVRVEVVEFTAYLDRLRLRRFEAAVQGYTADPSARGLRDQWGRAAAGPSGSNYAGYASAAFDAALDSALAAPSRAAARPYFHRAYQTIVDDAPAVWLFEPRPVLTYRRRLRVVGVRPDAWWAGLDRWTVVR